jgi:hypothetical protein
MNTQIIGFTGLKGSGKDSAALPLVWQGYQLLKFADCLKGMLRTFFLYTGANDEMIDRLIDGDLKETPCPALNGGTTRWAMQSLGTEWGRECIDPNLWTTSTIRRAFNYPLVVISDVRFPNEAAAIQAVGGRVVRIARPGQIAADHPSEKFVNSLDANITIQNDGTLAELQQKVLGLI